MHLFDIPPDSIDAVYFGMNFDRFLRDCIIMRVQNSDKLKHIRLYDAVLSDSKFVMEMKEITD